VVSLSARGGVRYHSVSGTARHERVRGRPAVGPRHDGDGSGSALQGKIGGLIFYGPAQEERGVGPGRKKRRLPSP
jgi:hypothetical protein